MDSKKVKQIVRQLQRTFDSWDYDKAIQGSNDEATTRDFLIHDFFEKLGYSKIDDFSHEYIADVGGKRGRKVDIAITLGKNAPQIIVECKKLGTSFTDNHFRQLNEYLHYTPSAKVGILTNGTVYQFYTRDTSSTTGLYPTPFYTFDLENFDSADLEMLALFNRATFEMNDIIEEAEEIYYLEKFDDALLDVLANPPEAMLKEICYKMGAKRVNDQATNQVKELINSISLKTALDRLIQKEVKSSNSGIITTEEEKKAYSVIKTIIALTNKIKNSELDRIGYRDLKGSFTILVDDNQNKKICAIKLGERSKSIDINGKVYQIDNTSVASLTSLKKELVESALYNLK